MTESVHEDIMDDSDLEFDENDQKVQSGMTNAEFISLLFSITIRLLIYGAVAVVIFIFIQGKSIDPVGYTRLINALTLTEQKPGVNLEIFIPIKENFDDFDYYTAPVIESANDTLNTRIKNSTYTTEPNQPFSNDIQTQRQELLQLSFHCHLLEQKAGILPAQSKCNKDHLSFHELVLDQELERNSRSYHLLLLNLLKRINDEFYLEDTINTISLDQQELTTFSGTTLQLIKLLQSTVLQKLQIDHETISTAKATENQRLSKNSEFIFDSKNMEKNVNSRVQAVFQQYPYE